ncbi:hypothetical protein KPL71_010865 [Citrus sinensis]|uniref:Uncharacterized protein n=1 Tax=Citrus sinensis TaxID=2711 RepID=A0ACB8MT81_CITSI|nr:hypothetical protein KPL71_010865 [Citrus sinensis]
MMMATTVPLPKYMNSPELSLPASKYDRRRVGIVVVAACFHKYSSAFGQKLHPRCFLVHVAQPYFVNNLKNILLETTWLGGGRKMSWAIGSSVDDNGFDPSSSDSSNGRTRLIRVIQAFQTRIGARIQELRKDFPTKLLFFLVGFYCATAFATVIGQTGDWDILSAALAVVVVEGIGALMYRASLRLLSKIRNLITMFNYWKAGLTLGLFLDSFN